MLESEVHALPQHLEQQCTPGEMNAASLYRARGKYVSESGDHIFQVHQFSFPECYFLSQEASSASYSPAAPVLLQYLE